LKGRRPRILAFANAAAAREALEFGRAVPRAVAPNRREAMWRCAAHGATRGELARSWTSKTDARFSDTSHEDAFDLWATASRRTANDAALPRTLTSGKSFRVRFARARRIYLPRRRLVITRQRREPLRASCS